MKISEKMGEKSGNNIVYKLYMKYVIWNIMKHITNPQQDGVSLLFSVSNQTWR